MFGEDGKKVTLRWCWGPAVNPHGKMWKELIYKIAGLIVGAFS